jgi:hypothetical protein
MKVLKSFAFKHFGGRAKHDYEKWLTGDVVQLDSDDFGDTKVGTMMMLIRKAARKRGVAVRISIDEKEKLLVCQSYEPSNDPYDTAEERAAAWREEDKQKKAAKQTRATQDGEHQEDTKEQGSKQSSKRGKRR